MRRPKRWILTFLWTFPADIVSWAFVLLVRILFGARLTWLDGLWVELRANSLLERTWGKSWLGFSAAHGGIFAAGRGGGPGVDTDTEKHELVHVEQFESTMLVGFILGMFCAVAFLINGCGRHALIPSLIIWLASWPLGYAASVAQAYLRGEDPYRGSHLEEGAYDATRNDSEPQ